MKNFLSKVTRVFNKKSVTLQSTGAPSSNTAYQQSDKLNPQNKNINEQKDVNLTEQQNLFEQINSKMCTLHDFKRYPNIKSNEYCESCNMSMCYMCSSSHLSNYCFVSLKIDKNKQMNTQDDKLKRFNQGYLSILKIDKLKCVCGTTIDPNSDHSAICVACGSATCSNQCHHNHLQKTDLCTFHHNFNSQIDKDISMRSIKFKNIKYLQDNQFVPGTPLCKTSNHFIKGFLSNQMNYIYLQRGYRQYGNPVEQTLNNTEVFSQKSLDYYTNDARVCDCDCEGCKLKSYHPAHNCEFECKQRKNYIINDLDHEELREECECQCQFCKSGKLLQTHTKQDCLFYCSESGYCNQ